MPRPSRSAVRPVDEGEPDIDMPRNRRPDDGADAGGGSGVPGSSGGGDPLDGPPGLGGSGLPAPRSQRPEPMPFVRTRDWTVVIECTADAVELSTGQKMPIATWPGGPSRDHPLRLAVEDLIRRRLSAGVSARPQIRFRVHPDGLRSYYEAFPALEPLKLLMKRENVDPNAEP
jgi:hypothetical protein